ncbi:glycosyltransferase [Sulfurihydrogenibium azorense]|uniref:glycosyltransferase n=1 Tax=Sulfurihydrogenibium azorense TaxID=309806 RepID=UPI003918C6F4
MRVLHLGKLCPPKEGGIEVFSYDLLEYLNLKGIKADLLCFGDKTFKESYKGFDFYSCKMNIKLNSAPLSLDFIKLFKSIEKKYDLIHVHSPNPLAEVISIFSIKKVVAHWHSDIVKQKLTYFFYKPFQQMYLKKADKIICTSPQYLNTSKQLEGFRDKGAIIPLGLNPRKFEDNQNDKNLKEEFEKLKNEGKKIVLSIGRLVEYKGFEYLVEAGKYINDNTAIVIVGDGPLFHVLKEKVKNLELEDKVFLTGRADTINGYIKNCDIFCLPSITRNEAFGLVLVEALYFGKPLITTDVYGSGMNYVNQNGITGFVVPPRNPIALAEAINKILGDANLYNNFSQNAKERFKEFEISNIGNRIIDLYKEILNRP